MLTDISPDVIGEQIVATELEAQGYATNFLTKPGDSIGIEAKKAGSKLLVQVKVFAGRVPPAVLTSEEQKNLRLRAMRFGFEPWEAGVQLDEDLHLVGKIQWRCIS